MANTLHDYTASRPPAAEIVQDEKNFFVRDSLGPSLHTRVSKWYPHDDPFKPVVFSAQTPRIIQRIHNAVLRAIAADLRILEVDDVTKYTFNLLDDQRTEILYEGDKVYAKKGEQIDLVDADRNILPGTVKTVHAAMKYLHEEVLQAQKTASSTHIHPATLAVSPTLPDWTTPVLPPKQVHEDHPLKPTEKAADDAPKAPSSPAAPAETVPEISQVELQNGILEVINNNPYDIDGDKPENWPDRITLHELQKNPLLIDAFKKLLKDPKLARTDRECEILKKCLMKWHEAIYKWCEEKYKLSAISDDDEEYKKFEKRHQELLADSRDHKQTYIEHMVLRWWLFQYANIIPEGFSGKRLAGHLISGSSMSSFNR